MIFSVLNDAAERGELLLVDSGICHFHRRRDGSVTIREIVVLPQKRRRRIGKWLVDLAGRTAPLITARCPADLPSNEFWKAIGFTLITTETTRTGKQVNVWQRRN
jgi:GNAT superfamily N-acetyltransferase